MRESERDREKDRQTKVETEGEKKFERMFVTAPQSKKKNTCDYKSTQLYPPL